MATTTTNLGLTLPDYTDTADIKDINDNMTTIDTAIGSLNSAVGMPYSNSNSLASRVGTLESSVTWGRIQFSPIDFTRQSKTLSYDELKTAEEVIVATASSSNASTATVFGPYRRLAGFDSTYQYMFAYLEGGISSFETGYTFAADCQINWEEGWIFIRNSLKGDVMPNRWLIAIFYR